MRLGVQVEAGSEGFTRQLKEFELHPEYSEDALLV